MTENHGRIGWRDSTKYSRLKKGRAWVRSEMVEDGGGGGASGEIVYGSSDQKSEGCRRLEGKRPENMKLK